MLDLMYYQTASGRSPVEEYIDRQDSDAQARILASLMALCEEFPSVVTVSIKHLRDKLWEIRVPDSRRRQHRVLYVVFSSSLIALHAFTKKTQRTPQRDISLALRRLREIMD